MTSQRLQGIGIVPTVSNKKLRIGDTLVFNYGTLEKIVGVHKKTPKGRVLLLKVGTKIYKRRKMDSGFSTIAIITKNKLKFITRP